LIKSSSADELKPDDLLQQTTWCSPNTYLKSLALSILAYCNPKELTAFNTNMLVFANFANCQIDNDLGGPPGS
jgi:hypothetical protein